MKSYLLLPMLVVASLSTAALAQETAAPAAPAAGDAAAASPEQLAQGKATYMTCMPCHQMTGAGLPPVFPPLTKSPYVNGSAERFIAMVLKGNAGPMTVDGKQYNNIMPPQEATLDDAKIADVTTYVRNSFGNSAPPVTKEQVAAARAKFSERKTPW